MKEEILEKNDTEQEEATVSQKHRILQKL